VEEQPSLRAHLFYPRPLRPTPLCGATDAAILVRADWAHLFAKEMLCEACVAAAASDSQADAAT
jgi:hypothetical protein